MRHAKLAFPALAIITLTGCLTLSDPTTTPQNPPTVVQNFELGRYTGLWYQIARYPNSFQRFGCEETTAEYALQQDGNIQVLNTQICDGVPETIVGTARVPDPNQPAQLEVSFFGPFFADYWVIELEPNYAWAVVGDPDRRLLWILSRTPTLPADTYNDILSRLPAQGYDPADLVLTSPMPQ